MTTTLLFTNSNMDNFKPESKIYLTSDKFNLFHENVGYDI